MVVPPPLTPWLVSTKWADWAASTVTFAWCSRVSAFALGGAEWPPHAPAHHAASAARAAARTHPVFCMPGTLWTDRRPLRRQVLDAVDEGGQQAIGFAGRVDVRKGA